MYLIHGDTTRESNQDSTMTPFYFKEKAYVKLYVKRHAKTLPYLNYDVTSKYASNVTTLLTLNFHPRHVFPFRVQASVTTL